MSSSYFEGVGTNKKTDQEFVTKSLYVTTDYKAQIVPVDVEVFKAKSKFYGSVTDFDPAFWEDFNYVQLNEAEKNAIFQDQGQ